MTFKCPNSILVKLRHNGKGCWYYLATGVENVIAVVPDAVDVVDGLCEAAGVEAALVVLHELLEAVLVELFVFHVKVLVLLHVGLVFEGEVAAAAVAVKVGRLLVAEGTVGCAAVLLTSEPDVKSKFVKSVTSDICFTHST